MPSFPTKEERIDRLRAGLQSKRSRSTLGQPADQNILTSVALHALGRHRRGKTPLSKLEAFTMGLFDKVARDDEELDAYIEAVSSARRSRSGDGWLTPATLALGEDEPYTKEHFQKDIASSTLGIDSASRQVPAHCRVIDPITGERLGLDDASFGAAVKQAGRSTTLYWSDTTPSSVDAISTTKASTDGSRVTLKPTVFYCHHKSKEVGKDEIYFSLAAGADSGDKLGGKQVTGERGSVKSGQWYDFPGGHVVFDGRVKNTLAAHIACWEADHSNSQWYTDLIHLCQAISQKSSEMASVTGNEYLDELVGQIPGVGTAYEILFWVEQVAGLIAGFLDLFRNHDDFVAEAFLAWNVPALDRLYLDNKKSEFAVMFDGGNGGKHEVWISRIHQANNFPGLVVNTLTSNDLRTWQQTKGNSVNGAVAMDEHGGKVWSVVALDADGAIGITDRPLVHGRDLEEVPEHNTPSRADIIAHEDAIHLVAQGTDDQLWYLNRQHHSSQWSRRSIKSTSTNKAPNICMLRNELICIFHSNDHNHYWMKLANDNEGYHRVQAHAPSAGPAGACALGDAIYYFYADKKLKLRVAIVRGHEVGSNSPSIEDYGLSPFESLGGISATVWKDQIYIAYTTVNPHGKPCIDRYDVNKKCLVSVKVFDDESCPASDPALGVAGGRLHLTYRKKK